MSLPLNFDPDAPAQGDGLFGLPFRPEDAAVVVVPVPFEATTSYGRGTARAPARVLAASGQVDLNDLDTGEPWQHGIAMLPIDPTVEAWNAEACALAEPVVAAGGANSPELEQNVQRVNAIGDLVNDWLTVTVRNLLKQGKIPGILGGDHSVPFGAHRAAVEKYPGLGFLHIDAHADCREAFEGFTWSHASIIWNLRNRVLRHGPIVSVGLRDVGREEARVIREWDDLWAFTDNELRYELAGGEPWLRVAARIVHPLPEKVWITLDVDGLEPQYCPATGTPVPGGLAWGELMLLFHVLAQQGKQVVGFDLCEVGDAEWDANVGARLLYKLAGWALATRPSP